MVYSVILPGVTLGVFEVVLGVAPGVLGVLEVALEVALEAVHYRSFGAG